METLDQIASSETTTKFLASLVIGINAAVILRSDWTLPKIFVLFTLVFIAICVVLSEKERRKQPREEENKKASREKTQTKINNVMLALLLFMTLTAI